MTTRLAPHQMRLMDERAELDQRLQSLRSFQTSHTFVELPRDEQRRLRRQSAYMGLLLGVMDERIEAFGGEA